MGSQLSCFSFRFFRVAAGGNPSNPQNEEIILAWYAKIGKLRNGYKIVPKVNSNPRPQLDSATACRMFAFSFLNPPSPHFCLSFPSPSLISIENWLSVADTSCPLSWISFSLMVYFGFLHSFIAFRVFLFLLCIFSFFSCRFLSLSYLILMNNCFVFLLACDVFVPPSLSSYYHALKYLLV